MVAKPEDLMDTQLSFLKLLGVVGDETTTAIMEFFSSSRKLKEVNATAVTHVPKVQNADNMTNFRPIVFLNCLQTD